MDQSRLEELKRLLNKQRSNTKQNLDRELDAENSNAQNSDTSNSNASNFDASDLNNINFKTLNFNDKNSDDLNLNAEYGRKFQNLDPDNTTLFKNSNARNYDKDPIIIKNYEKFFVYARLFIILPASGLPLFFIRDIIDFEHIDTNGYLAICMTLLLIAIITYILTAIRNKREIRFTDQYIEFLDKGIVKRWCKVEEGQLRKNFSTSVFNTSFFIVSILLCIGSLGVILVFLFFMYAVNILIKFVVYFCINKGLKGFQIFPFIKVAEPWYGNEFMAFPISAHYYLVYLYSSEVYDEVKEYFLQKNINIDFLKKDYTVFI